MNNDTSQPIHAFPQAVTMGDKAVVKDGMTLRDYFAAKWLTSIKVVGKAHADIIAKECYVMADAMMQARER